jgi:hypothetical protein
MIIPSELVNFVVPKETAQRKRIWEVLASNLIREQSIRAGFSLFHSDSPGKFEDNALK